MRTNTVASAWLALARIVYSAYIWPSPNDEIEDIFSHQAGYLRKGFIDLVNPCSFGSRVQGRQNAAEWIRTAFHDMATHDVATGAGGLDSSIIFELDRAENIGGAFNNTFSFFNSFYSVRASASDLLALSVVAATGMCFGPEIPFRVGRIDADSAGPAGVPEPHTSLEDIRNAFTKSGFDEKDMITMIACGHTLGGVHSTDFPELTGGNADPNNDTVSHFDSTPDRFDANIATEYVNGTTLNPLVVAGNDTLNSDKRVFAADGNRTISALASNLDLFRSSCGSLFGRMIDTVPSTVTLSDPIAPPDVKPYITALYLNGNDTISFAGRVRIRTSADAPYRWNDLAVNITYAERNGETVPTVIPTRQATFQGGSTTGLFGENFLWFEFSTTILPDSGISKFFIHVMTPSNGVKTLYDNVGRGYPVSDAVLYQELSSCLNTDIVDGEMALTVTAMVREQEHKSSCGGSSAPLTLDLVQRVPRPGVIVPRLEREQHAFQPTGRPARGGYVEYRVTAGVLVDGWSTTFDILGKNGGKVEFKSTSVLASNTCPE